MGIDTRTTMDMDTCIKGININDKELYKILTEILSIDVKDNVSFEIKNDEPIRNDDKYGGIKFNILATFENIKVNLSIDIATGDIITPREIEYEYKMLFEEKSIKIMSYNIETIIAEKFQTMISRGILNSRMKDYYDLYFLIRYKNFSVDNLKMAIKNTFNRRSTEIDDISDVMDEIKSSDFIVKRWSEYSNKHSYAKNIHLEDILGCIEKIIQKL